MKKESIVAAVSGIVLGVVIAVIILINLKNKEIKSKKTISPQITPTVTILNVKMQGLEILDPINDAVVNKSEIIIKGKADKDSLIVVQSPTMEKVEKIVTNEFSINFSLSSGENLIKITSYKDKSNEEKSLKVYYIVEE
jgi:hypothetical protein